MTTKLTLSTYTLYRYHSEYYGNYLALVVSIGHKWIHYVCLGYPIAIKKARVTEAKYFTDIGYKGNPRTKMLEYMPLMGATKGAEDYLRSEEV